ncbi:MAG: alpha/beta fold hydrolase [Microcoleaceae cyanobacterium MO_207.B10]|nr:alpha/beta fold hydrolase [Microcoleaceae cyanobacterium MO_207.B10]
MLLSELPYFSGFETVPPKYQIKLWSDGLPWYYKNEQNQTNGVVICLHGFTATPYEIRPVGKTCLERGIDAVAPLLPGHGYAQLAAQKTEFSKMTKEVMFEAVRQEISRARKHYEFVGIFGHSMGGAIALTMASEGLVDACTVTAPAIKLPFRVEILTGLLGWANISLPKNPDNFNNPNYLFDNSKAGLALQRIALHSRQYLSQITCPTLVVHSHNDPLIDAIVVQWIKAQVKGTFEAVWFDESGHVMTLDVKGKEVAETVAQFLAKQIK